MCYQRAGWYEGPSGGISQNIFCANEACAAGYNEMGPGFMLGGQLIKETKLSVEARVILSERAETFEPPAEDRQPSRLYRILRVLSTAGASLLVEPKKRN